MYRQALGHVQSLDVQHGREAGPHTRHIAGALTAAAATAGMSQIDHVVLSQDSIKAYAMQGAENSPFKQHVEVDVTQAARAPLAQSSREALGHAGHAQSQQIETPMVSQQQNVEQNGPTR